MHIRLLAALAMSALFAPSLAVGQTVPGDVTFEVPINLTRLNPEISRVMITCVIYSSALVDNQRQSKGRWIPRGLPGQLEVPVTAGRIERTVDVVVRVPAGALKEIDAKNAAANYECSIMAGTRSGSWVSLGDDPLARAGFEVRPVLQILTGNFTW